MFAAIEARATWPNTARAMIMIIILFTTSGSKARQSGSAGGASAERQRGHSNSPNLFDTDFNH